MDDAQFQKCPVSPDPYDSETGWTGELWSNTDLIKYKNFEVFFLLQKLKTKPQIYTYISIYFVLLLDI